MSIGAVCKNGKHDVSLDDENGPPDLRRKRLYRKLRVAARQDIGHKGLLAERPDATSALLPPLHSAVRIMSA
ncbi:MAG: hypothetical protein KKB02_13805, partial [Alphaproteobacteria bacterium]|nr:hypothetical protein [Alphaproteobacteria bacterium]